MDRSEINVISKWPRGGSEHRFQFSGGIQGTSRDSKSQKGERANHHDGRPFEFNWAGGLGDIYGRDLLDLENTDSDLVHVENPRDVELFNMFESASPGKKGDYHPHDLGHMIEAYGGFQPYELRKVIEEYGNFNSIYELRNVLTLEESEKQFYLSTMGRTSPSSRHVEVNRLERDLEISKSEGLRLKQRGAEFAGQERSNMARGDNPHQKDPHQKEENPPTLRELEVQAMAKLGLVKLYHNNRDVEEEAAMAEDEAKRAREARFARERDALSPVYARPPLESNSKRDQEDAVEHKHEAVGTMQRSEGPRPQNQTELGHILLERQKMALANLERIPKSASEVASSSKPFSPPPFHTGSDLLELQKVALANMTNVPIALPLTSVTKSPLSGVEDLLELQKAASKQLSAERVRAAQTSVAPSAAHQQVGGGDLSELQRVALAKMKIPHSESPSQPKLGTQPALSTPQTSTHETIFQPTARVELLELQKVALGNIQKQSASTPATAQLPTSKAGKLRDQERVPLVTSKDQSSPPHLPQSERGDLSELQKLALANMNSVDRQGGKAVPATREIQKTPPLKKTDYFEGIVSSSPTSSSPSLSTLTPADGQLENLLRELSAKNSALESANRKLDEKDHLLQEYENELAKALNMLDSINVRYSKAKEKTTKVLDEAEEIFGDLNKACSAVESFEGALPECGSNSESAGEILPAQGTSPGSAIGSATPSADIDESHFFFGIANKLKDKQMPLEEEERRKWVKELIEDLKTIERARSKAQNDFAIQMKKTGQLIVELQQGDVVHPLSHRTVNDLMAHNVGPGEKQSDLEYETQFNLGDHEDDHEHAYVGADIEIPTYNLESFAQDEKHLIEDLENVQAKVLKELQDLNIDYPLKPSNRVGRQSGPHDLWNHLAQFSKTQPQNLDVEKLRLTSQINKLERDLDLKNRELQTELNKTRDLHGQGQRLQSAIAEQEKLKDALNQKANDSSSTLVVADLERTIEELRKELKHKTREISKLQHWIHQLQSDMLQERENCRIANEQNSNKIHPDLAGDQASIDVETRSQKIKNLHDQVLHLQKKLQAEQENHKEALASMALARNATTDVNKLLGILQAKEKKVKELQATMAKQAGEWQAEKHRILHQLDDSETRLLVKEEEAIKLSRELEMAKPSLYSHPIDSMLSHRDPSHFLRTRGNEEHCSEILDLRAEVLSLQDCLEIKTQALQVLEKEVTRSYETVTKLRRKVAEIQESGQRSRNQAQKLQESNNNIECSRHKRKWKSNYTVGIPPRTSASRYNPPASSRNADLLAKIRSKEDQVECLESEKRIMTKKIEDLVERCKHLEELQHLQTVASDDMKEHAVKELECELDRNVQILKKMQERCSEFEARAKDAEARYKSLFETDQRIPGVPTDISGTTSSNDDSNMYEKKTVNLEGPNDFHDASGFPLPLRQKFVDHSEKLRPNSEVAVPEDKTSSALVSECTRLRLEMTLYKELMQKKDQELSRLQGELENLTTRRTSPPIQYQSASEEQFRSALSSFEQKRKAPMASTLLGSSSDLEISKSSSPEAITLRAVLKEQWKLQKAMEERLNAMMAYVSDRVDEFEQTSSSGTPSDESSAPAPDLNHFHVEAKLMKLQLEEQLQILRGTLFSSFRPPEEAQEQTGRDAPTIAERRHREQILYIDGPSVNDESSEQHDIQLLMEKLALEKSARALQAKTSRLLDKLTTVRTELGQNVNLGPHR